VPQLIGGDKENPIPFTRIERVIVQVEDKRALTLEHDAAETTSENDD
jgi:hypothetical protein